MDPVKMPGRLRAVFRWSPFRKRRELLIVKWAAVAAALGGVYAVAIYLLWDAVREPLFLKWAAVAAALGVYAVGIYFLRGLVRDLLSLRWVAAAIALGVYAVGTYLLWRFVAEPFILRWALVFLALAGLYAVGIYVLWCAVREPLFLKWAAVVVALGVCAVGIVLLWGVWDGTPVTAAFTRVGGATRVETGLDASRFWLTPPRYVVKTQTDSSQLMLGAARCAVAHDAPLLFTSRDLKRKRRVDAIVNDWRHIRNQESAAPLKVIYIKSQPDVTGCLGKRSRADIAGLSTLKVPDPLIGFHHVVQTRQTLASVVVFAAAIKPGHLPDVAIGLALAAHLAKANQEKVSLVVVPHYLESDPGLEKELQSQHEPVTGGVVLGQTPTVPEDTRALLRQLLISTDRQGILAQVQNNLGSAGALIAALLALAGAAAAARIAGPIVIEHLERTERTGPRGRAGQPGPAGPGTNTPTQVKGKWMSILSHRPKQSVAIEKSDWLAHLDGSEEVTVWLRSGRKVTGTIEGQIPDNTRDATVFRIKSTRRSREDRAGQPLPGPLPPQDDSSPRPDAAHVLVSVKDIELIEINDPQSETSKASQTSS